MQLDKYIYSLAVAYATTVQPKQIISYLIKSIIFILQPKNQWIIIGASVFRVIFVPMLMLCNAQPRQHLPVVFLWDWEYIIIMIIFAFTNGYLTNIVMINSTK